MTEFKMSLFLAPISPVRDADTGQITQPATLTPYKTLNIREVYEIITTNKRLQALTLQVRQAAEAGDTPTYRALKQKLLPYVTPCGTFSRRRGDCLLEASGLVVVDVDHLDSTEEAEELRRRMFDDPFLKPELVFISPCGRGVKAFIPYDLLRLPDIRQNAAESIYWAMGYVQCAYGDGNLKSDNRRTDKEYREVKKMYLSVLLSGTPAQVKPLIPTAENGLFSRQIFYYMPAIHRWKNQFDQQDTNLEDVFTDMGMEWKKKLQNLICGGLYTLRLTDSQKEEFNNIFSHLFVRSGMTNGDEMSSSIARLAINICRIMEVVAMLRVLETENPAASPHVKPDNEIPADNLKDGIITRWDLSIGTDDFHAVLALTEALYRHTTHILSFLPGTEVTHRSNADRDALLQSMPMKFTRADFLRKAEEMGFKPDTASTWLKRIAKRGMIENVDGKGTYLKPVVTEV